MSTLRSRVVRLAASMPKGSTDRKALINLLVKDSPRVAARKPPLKRQAPDGHYQVLIRRDKRIDGGKPYISDAPSIQVAMRDAREKEKMEGVESVEIYDSLGNFFATMVNGRLKTY